MRSEGLILANFVSHGTLDKRRISESECVLVRPKAAELSNFGSFGPLDSRKWKSVGSPWYSNSQYFKNICW